MTFKVVADTCVLLPPRVSDLLFDMHLLGLCEIHWSKKTEEEFLRNFPEVVLRQVKEKLTPEVMQSMAQARLNNYRRATNGQHKIPRESQTSIIELVPKTVDRNDVHVAAGAIRLSQIYVNEDIFLITENIADIPPKELSPLNIKVKKFGEFIDMVYASNPKLTQKCVETTINDLTRPRGTKVGILNTLLLYKANKAANSLAKQWKVQLPVSDR